MRVHARVKEEEEEESDAPVNEKENAFPKEGEKAKKRPKNVMHRGDVRGEGGILRNELSGARLPLKSLCAKSACAKH